MGQMKIINVTPIVRLIKVLKGHNNENKKKQGIMPLFKIKPNISVLNFT